MEKRRVFAPWDVEGSNRYNAHADSLTYTLECYRNDAVVVRSWRPDAALKAERTDRGKIGSLPSSASLKRLIFILNNADVGFCSMLTLTMTPKVNLTHSVDDHRKSIKAVCQRLRRDHVQAYCWVREFQSNGSVHWHVFTDLHVGQPGDINRFESNDWSRWWAEYWRKKNASLECVRKMIHGNGKEFQCCRFEQLKTNAGGRYAAKEGAKRFQKVPPRRWRKNGGAWWRASRGLTCTPIKTIEVSGDSLQWATVKRPDGTELDVPLKLQFSRGLRECSSHQGD